MNRVIPHLLTKLGNKLYTRLRDNDHSIYLENKIFDKIMRIKPKNLSYRYR